MKRCLALALNVALLQAVSGGAAEATPMITYNGSILGNDFVPIAEVFAGNSFDGGTATTQSISGFTTISDCAGVAACAGVTDYTIEDVERDETPAGTSITANSVDTFYGDFDAGPAMLNFGGTLPASPELIGTNWQDVVRQDRNGVLPAAFDGTFNLATTGTTTPAGLAFFNEVSALTGGSALVAFSGSVTGFSETAPGEFLINFETALVPVMIEETVLGTSVLDAMLLGGSAIPGGINIGFTAGATGGDVSVTSDSLSAAEFAALDPNDVTGQLGALGIQFAGGEVQYWTVDYAGDIDGLATVVLTYDDRLFGDSFDETLMGVGHVPSSGPNAGTLQVLTPISVDQIANTVTVQVDGFSDFVLLAPEPSTALLLAVGLVGLAVRGRRLH